MTIDPEKPQRFKYVDFDLPFILFVKDSLGDPSLKEWAEAYAAGKKPLPYSPYAPSSEKPGHLVIGGGLPVYIPPDDLADFYQVNIPEFPVGIRLLRRVNPHKSTVMMGEVPGDRAGKASFSSVRVMFDMRVIDRKHHQNFPVFCELAVKAINHLIDHYRVIANRPYVGSVTMNTIQTFQVITHFEDGEQQSQQYGTGSGPLHGMGGAITDKQDEGLRAAVAKAEPPHLEATLDVNIRDHLDLHEWRLAMIEIAVTFEAWLNRHLRDAFRDAGVADEDIDQKFLDGRGLPRSVTSVAKKLVNEAFGLDFESTQEYLEWATKVRDVRNDIVHGKRFDVSGEEAAEAYKAMRNAVSLITSVSGGVGSA